jgi:hypothetical protein
MSDDSKMVELLADILHEMKSLREDFRSLRVDFKGMQSEQHSMQLEQRRTTNAVWELSQMMQKVI